ncbi:hypothetical protein GBAR_LOCUS4795 [Geodia barretti]|uniref:Uncharacterized protein n=1 Tax=Geodia barretti TaxID=519541 RepID=A0AA35R9I3_GEOBA|nr:hypothetical protein GBAR_LOCUS4795 [Geodia barretti]
MPTAARCRSWNTWTNCARACWSRSRRSSSAFSGHSPSSRRSSKSCRTTAAWCTRSRPKRSSCTSRSPRWPAWCWPSRSSFTNCGASSRRGCTPARSGSPFRSSCSPRSSSWVAPCFRTTCCFRGPGASLPGSRRTTCSSFHASSRPFRCMSSCCWPAAWCFRCRRWCSFLPGSARDHAPLPRAEHEVRGAAHLHFRGRAHADRRSGDADDDGGADDSALRPEHRDRLGLPAARNKLIWRS